MKILLDECLPRRLKQAIVGQEVFTVPEMGWAGTKNGELLRRAEEHFDIFVTIDQNLQYQQNLQSNILSIIILVAPDNRYDTLRSMIAEIQQVVSVIKPGEVKFVKV